MSDQVHWVRTSEPLPHYTLSASIGLTVLTLRFDAEDDTDAAFIAMREVLDRAAREKDFFDDQKFWGKGTITLTDPNGKVLRTMLSKGESNG